jgi:hypothetical protein
MKTIIRGVEDTLKENREECMLMGGDVGKRRGRMGKQNPNTR